MVEMEISEEKQNDNDDISIATDTAENRTIRNVGEEKEYVVKFLFARKGTKTTQKLQKRTMPYSKS